MEVDIWNIKWINTELILQMKKLHFYVLTAIFAGILFASCTKTETQGTTEAEKPLTAKEVATASESKHFKS